MEAIQKCRSKRVEKMPLKRASGVLAGMGLVGSPEVTVQDQEESVCVCLYAQV